MAAGDSGERPILLVDDEPVLREAIRQLLERGVPGCVVLSCGTGPDALAATQDRRPSIAVLDVDMSPMDGLVLAHELRARWADLPIMFITGTAQENIVPEIEKLGVVAYLRKPVKAAELLALVEQHRQIDS